MKNYSAKRVIRVSQRFSPTLVFPPLRKMGSVGRRVQMLREKLRIKHQLLLPSRTSSFSLVC